jgi:serine/threonine protein kinase
MQVGQIIGEQFEVGDFIRQGGMGAVYRGRDKHSGQTVAIKLLKANALTADPANVERFEREGQALRTLNHPNIVKMLAMVEQNNQHYLIMEYVSGGSLADLLEVQRQLPIPRLLEIALDLADALTRTHRLNIIHRDLKPANVLIAEDGTPRLTDFGVARIGNSDVTGTDQVVGTYNYLSPEALNGLPLDARADIWAFGVLLFEMLAGCKPFAADNLGALINTILTKPVPDSDLTRLSASST